MTTGKIKRLFVLSSILLIVVVLLFTGFLNIASFKQNYSQALISGYAIAGGETVRKIEYAVKYGKPIENFFGIEELLSKITKDSPEIGEVQVVLPDGTVLYNQNGGVTGNRLSEGLTEQIHFADASASKDYVSLLDGGSYYVFMPIRDSQSRWAASLELRFDGAVVQSHTDPYMVKLIIYLVLLAIASLLVLLIVVSRIAIVSDEGEIKKKRLLTILLIILGTVQLVYGVLNYELFRAAYVAAAKQTTAFAANMISRDINSVIDKGVPYSKLYNIEDNFDRIIRSVPLVGAIHVSTKDGQLLHSTQPSSSGQYQTNDPDFTTDVELAPDTDKKSAMLSVELSRPYLRSKLNDIIMDTATVLVTSFLFMVEITLFSLIMLRRKVSRSSSEEEDGSSGVAVVRTVSFVLFMAFYMCISFIPIVTKKLYEPIFGLSQSVIVGLPISMEMLCAGAFTVIAGYIIDKRGWRTTFFTGLALYGAGTILSGLAPHVLVFVLARGIAGAGFGFTTMAIRGYVNTSANEKVRSEGVSAFITGLFAGLNCGVIVGAMLADRVGFTTVFYISFGLLAVGGLFALAFMRGASIKQSVQTAASAAKGGILSFFGNREVLVFFLCILVPTAISGMFLDYFFPVFAESIGISSSNIGRAFLVNGLVVVYFGPLLSKWCSKYLNVKQSLILAAVTVISSLLFFATQGTVAAAFVVVILLGVADSFGLVAQNNYFVQLEATGRIGRGKAFGYYGNVKKLGQMLGPVVFGGVAGLGYIGVGLVGAVFLASLTLFMISARSKRRNDINRQNGLNI